MNISHISFKRILDTVDYVPAVSSIKNLADIFAKHFWNPDLKELSVQGNMYYEHINDKSYLRCVLLLIPVFGNVLVGLYDLAKETEAQVIKKEQDICDKIRDEVQVACKVFGASVCKIPCSSKSGDPSLSYCIVIERNRLMDGETLDTEKLDLEMLAIKAAVEQLHKTYGAKALDAAVVSTKDGGDINITFSVVSKNSLETMIQTGPHNHPSAASFNKSLLIETQHS